MTHLAAVRSLFSYAALHAPEHAELISRVLAIPPKRCDRAIISYLTAEESDALLAAPDRGTCHGRRDTPCSSSTAKPDCACPN